MDPKRDFIDRILPYRLGSVEVLTLALRYQLSWSAPVPMQIFFDGALSIDGLSTAFTNPAIEAGIIHCRALLEFLGLAIDQQNQLVQRSHSRPTDLSIEQFSNTTGPLPLVTPARAVASYSGPAVEAQRALARVIHIANKGLAHATTGLILDPDDLRLVEIASRGVRTLLINHFYIPLRLEPPPQLIRDRRREP